MNDLMISPAQAGIERHVSHVPNYSGVRCLMKVTTVVFVYSLIWEHTIMTNCDNRMMRMTNNRSALNFGCDIIVPQPIKKLPFGFHRAETFVDFLDRGWVK